MIDACGDNRFEIIREAKEALIASTNITQSPKEMAVLNDFLFRCWQMGWLKKYEQQPTTDGWIPVSKELPKEDGEYLCTTNHGTIGVYSFSNDLYSVDHYDFVEYKGKKKRSFYACDSEWGYSKAYYITAWRPLPQPYKE